jgi:hypothetical protein
MLLSYDKERFENNVAGQRHVHLRTRFRVSDREAQPQQVSRHASSKRQCRLTTYLVSRAGASSRHAHASPP